MKPLNILSLSDGISGHWSITAGLVRWIGTLIPVSERVVPVRWRLGASRQLLQYMMRLGIPQPRRMVDFLATGLPIDSERPDLIVSRGGATLALNVWLARYWNCRNIFVGSPRNVPLDHFSAVVQQGMTPDNPPHYFWPVLPTRIDEAELAQKVAEFSWPRPLTGQVWGAFIGGAGSGFSYRSEDWRNLAAGLNALSDRYGIRWLVVTSRRTGAAGERLLQDSIRSDVLAATCWWHAGDRRPCFEAFLGACETAFCTADSMTMIEEILCARKPLTVVSPMAAHPPARFAKFLEERQTSKLIVHYSLAELAELRLPDRSAWKTLSKDDFEMRTRKLLDDVGITEAGRRAA